MLSEPLKITNLKKYCWFRFFWTFLLGLLIWTPFFKIQCQLQHFRLWWRSSFRWINNLSLCILLLHISCLYCTKHYCTNKQHTFTPHSKSRCLDRFWPREKFDEPLGEMFPEEWCNYTGKKHIKYHLISITKIQKQGSFNHLQFSVKYVNKPQWSGQLLSFDN